MATRKPKATAPAVAVPPPGLVMSTITAHYPEAAKKAAQVVVVFRDPEAATTFLRACDDYLTLRPDSPKSFAKWAQRHPAGPSSADAESFLSTSVTYQTEA